MEPCQEYYWSNWRLLSEVSRQRRDTRRNRIEVAQDDAGHEPGDTGDMESVKGAIEHGELPVTSIP